ncbi:uncharacterized protein LOC129222133 [Uloborus diversus]|uniref:uncharacterized protein LOC129222133 n=1 Tax=Uloborus diversus TaxID=327109 RepID=UPI0024090368|nr:uncharacterized protein LOC129222133 [Uloborus diversus]
MLSRILVPVLAAIPFFVYPVFCAPKCNDSDLKWCMEELKVLTSNQDLAFAYTEEELSKTCGHLQGAMQCVNNFTSRCFDDTQRELYRTLTNGAQQLLSDLCTQDSEIRRQYLVHAGCYRNLSADYRKCADDYLHQQESTKKSDLSVKERLRKSCCLFDGYKECTREAVLSKCSTEAADLGELIVTKAGGPLVQTHCANFKHKSPDCEFATTSAASSHRYSSVLTRLVAALLVFYILLKSQNNR